MFGICIQESIDIKINGYISIRYFCLKKPKIQNNCEFVSLNIVFGVVLIII